MKVLLTGASGFIGRHVAAALVAAGHEVRPVSRRDGVDAGSGVTPAHWRPMLAGVHAVVHSIGLIAESHTQRFETLQARVPMALFAACEQAGVRRVVSLSALGADASAGAGFLRTKGLADDALRGSALDWVLLRPSLVQGPGGTSAALFGRLAALPWIPVVDGGLQRVQPVHVDDVVAAVLQALTVQPARRMLDLVGPEAMAFADWLARLRRARGLPPAPLLNLPGPLARALLGVAGPLHPLLRRQNLDLLAAGSTADARPFEQFLGRPLRDAATGRPPTETPR